MSESHLIAVTGASGLLGRPLMSLLEADIRFVPRGAAFSRAAGALDRVDLTSPTVTEEWLNKSLPSALIHCAAERRPDVYAENPEAADNLNITGTRFLAAACADRDIPILFLSTNYVFDGTAAPYAPDSPEAVPNPLNAYGRSKLAGEQAVLEASSGNRVLRIPMLFGLSDNLAESAVTIIAEAFQKGEGPVLLDVRQNRYPAFAGDIAATLVSLLPGLISGNLPGPHFHFCPPEDQSFTKRDLGEILAPYVGGNPSRAVADDRPPSGAPRPENVRMICPNLEALNLLKVTPFREAIAITMESIRSAGGLDN